MSSPRSRPAPPQAEYVYRRELEARELVPAIGLGLGVGLAAFYVARLFIQRTPLDVSGSRDDLRSQRATHG